MNLLELIWVEVEVEKALGLNSKHDIKEMGLKTFANYCKARVKKYSEIITRQSKQLGQQMDWQNSYFTHSDNNIVHIWHFFKECHKKGWLYKSCLVMPWCPRCSTSLSAHEMADSYKEIEHPSVYLQLPVVGEPNRFFLVWTTTPWTLTANTALAVHPKKTYLLLKYGEREYYIAEDAIGILPSEFIILEYINGLQLVEKQYIAPFSELELQKNVTHRIVPWEDVSVKEGTGIVHIAPGCGAEDFNLGKNFGLDILSPIDETGKLVDGLEPFTGFFTNEAASLIIKSLIEKGFLFETETIVHRYPICWRCKTELVFKLESEWFISCDEIRPLLLKANEGVKWVPSHASKRMNDWLTNMGDWCISRKRYWGLPLPFYECDCGETTVIGSKRELQALANIPQLVAKLPELHRPWIDDIEINCSSCGKITKRIPEVGDCWLDAGIVPFSTLNYLTDRSYWQKWFPAELVCEMIEQVRLWFYSMLFMAITLEGRAPYETVVIYDEVRNEDGSPMHKSSGNMIEIDEALQKMGADVMRWNYASQKNDSFLRFGYNVTKDIRRKFIPFWNAVRFFVNFAALDITNPTIQLSYPSKNIFDKWILVRMNELVEEYHEHMENGNLKVLTQLVEGFLNDLTNWYIRLSRRRFWKEKSQEDLDDKFAAYSTLYKVLINLSKLLAPFMPFLAEYIYLLLKPAFPMKLQESVHLCTLPLREEIESTQEIMKGFQEFQTLVELGRLLRNKTQIKLRQPLSLAVISKKKPFMSNSFSEDLFFALKKELNVKAIQYTKNFKSDFISNEKYVSGITIDGNFLLVLVTELTRSLIQEGLARELVRIIQQVRKQSKLELDTKIMIHYSTKSQELVKNLKEFSSYIKSETLTIEFKEVENLETKHCYKINGYIISFSIETVTS